MGAYEYIGPGFIPGVPARDISAEEVERRDLEGTLEASAIYKQVTTRRRSAVAEDTGEGDLTDAERS